MTTDLDPKTLDAVARQLESARSLLFVTGAGISADSGLPTYRGIGGLYDREMTEEGVPIETALSGGMLQSNPALCWKYMSQIEEACRGASPNRAHEIIAELEATKERCWVLTQNVDDLHRAAGSSNLIEIHGNIHNLTCLGCGRNERREDLSELQMPPKCERCGALVRPRVVLFGEMLPLDEVSKLRRELARGFDLVFSIGTTSVFPYIAEPVVLAQQCGSATVEVNPGTSEISHLVDHRLCAGAATAMEALRARLP